MLLAIAQVKQSARQGRSTRASLASLGPGVLQTHCKTELFLGLVSAPRHSCTIAANVSRAAWLYVSQELAQAGVTRRGTACWCKTTRLAPSLRCRELGLQAAALVLTLESQGRVSSALLLGARLPLLLSHVLPAAAASQPQHGAGGTRTAPPPSPGLRFLAGTRSQSPVTRPKLLTARPLRPPACRACSACGTT